MIAPTAEFHCSFEDFSGTAEAGLLRKPEHWTKVPVRVSGPNQNFPLEELNIRPYY
jgi:hypothetical protein